MSLFIGVLCLLFLAGAATFSVALFLHYLSDKLASRETFEIIHSYEESYYDDEEEQP